MRKEAREILKIAYAAHGEQLFSDSGVCFGLLKDYGGNDHPEVKLLADAVDQDFPRRLLEYGSVSPETIDRLAKEFAERRFYDRDLCRWAVESWAIVLGLQYENPQPVAVMASPVPPTYPGPTYVESGFDQPFAELSTKGADVKVKSLVQNTVLTGYQRADIATTQTYAGIGRLAYAGIGFGLNLVSGALQGAASGNSGLSGLVLVVAIVANVILVAQRLKNIGRNPWLSLLSPIPIVSIFICIPCLYAPPNYANTKTLDRAGRVIIWILWGLAGLVVLGVVIYLFARHSSA
jgi:uncharacterized membrane protein YhaH (DUF805 family)